MSSSLKTTSPNEWNFVKIKDISKRFIGGGTPSTKNREYWNGNIPWMTSAILVNMYLNEGMRKISEIGLNNSSSNLVPKDSLIISTRVGIGKVGIAGIDIAINQDLTGIILDQDKALPEYIYWILSNSKNKLLNISQGTTVKGIERESLENLKVLLPSLKEQYKINSILSNVNNLISNTQKIIGILQVLKKGLMQHLFTEGIGHTEFKETKVGRIPKEWDIVKLEDVANINPSYEVPEQDDYLFLEMSSIDEESFKPNYWLRRSKDKLTNTIFKNGDVLFAKITPCVENGKGALIQELNESVASGSTELVVLSPIENINSFFLYYLTKTEKFRNKAISLMEGATGRQRVPNYFFKSYNVMLPSLNEQKEISNILQNVDNRIIDEKKLVLFFKKIKKGLMQDLLTGKKRVKVN